MKKLIIILVLLSIRINSQNLNTEPVFVMINNSQNENLFLFEKGANSEYAKIKILYYDMREKGFKRNEVIESKKDTIYVKAVPNNIIYYEFISKDYPRKINNISGLKVYSIEDVSKNKKSVWREYPYTIFFIEKLECNIYNLWKMNPILHE